MSHLLKKYWVLFVILAFILLIIAGGAAGYRVGPGLKIEKNGTLSIYNLPEGTAVYTDERNRDYAVKGQVKIPLLPGAHTVIVDEPGYQPWNELFTITAEEDTVLNPIEIPADVKASTLRGAEMSAAQVAIWSEKLPTKAKPLSIAGGCAYVYADRNDVIAEASTTATGCAIPDFLKAADGSYAPTVIYSAEQLNDVLPYPNRGDALVVASGATLYAVEVDPRGPQFLRALAKGAASLHAGYDAAGTLYATDGTRTVSISFDK
jgi:hypothetical protein